MALVTVRSPSVAGSPQCSNSDSEADDEEGGGSGKNGKSECFFAGKGTALVLSLKDPGPLVAVAERRLSTDSTRSSNSTQSNNSDIQQHLQSMFYLLRHEETLKMAVKLESQRPNRTRYLVIASRCCYCPNTTQIDQQQQHQPQQNQQHRSKINRNSKNTSANNNNSNMRTSSTITTTTTTTTTTESSSSSNDRLLEQSTDDSATPTTASTATTTEVPVADTNQITTMTTTTTTTSSSSNDPSTDCSEGIEESCLLGIDCNERTTIGLVVPILADTTIRLDGDGGFSVKVYDKTYIFKPVSVQAMWSALQTLHKVSQKARENNFYFGGPSHDWLTYYENRIESEQSCLNEWNAMDSLESRRPPSPDAIRNKPTAKEETESTIKMKLKEIMMSVDLDEVTSKYIRSRLEEHLDMDLGEFKEFIDAEMLTILGQMDAPTEIFEHVYLGSEWNASNLEELQKNGVRHILNVTREIDNFFPGMFDYFNVRVYDDEKTNLLKHWDNTFRYITRAKAEGSKVLVHCKMGVSRSASVVIAYAMKAYNWEFQQALQHVKARRSCIKPNKNFLNQLETYRGMLDAMKNKEKLQRSKSETNLKSTKDARLLPGSEPTPLIQALNQSTKSKSAGYEVCLSGEGDGDADVDAAVVGVILETAQAVQKQHHHHHLSHSRHHHVNVNAQQHYGSPTRTASDAANKSTTAITATTFGTSMRDGVGDTTTLLGRHRQRRALRRSSSTSPKILKSQTSLGGSGGVTQSCVLVATKQQSQSLENLTPERSVADEPKNMRFPGSNGENYSVTQNQVLHIQKNTPPPAPPMPPTAYAARTSKVTPSSNNTTTTTSSTSVRTIINDLETHGNERKTAEDRKILNLPFGRSMSHDNSNSSTTTTTTTSTSSTVSYSNSSNQDERDDSPIWTSSAKLITQTNRLMQQQQRHQQKREDALMQETEKRYRRKTHSWAAGSSHSAGSSSDGGNNIVMEDNGEVRTRQRVTRELPARHASWGSGDQQRIMPPMRNSSWGSYDTNKTRNNHNQNTNNNATFCCPFQYSPVAILFEGQVVNNELTIKSYKTAPHDITTTTTTTKKTTLPSGVGGGGTGGAGGGTVKRTKQKLLEESSCTQKKLRNNSQLYRSVSSAGAPTYQQQPQHYAIRSNSHDDSGVSVSDMTARHSNEFYGITATGDNDHVFHATLTDISQPTNLITDNSVESDDASLSETSVVLRGNFDGGNPIMAEDQRVSAGNVQILKKNFEARASSTAVTVSSTVTTTTTQAQTSPTAATKKGHHSLPSSPIAEHARSTSAAAPILTSAADNTNSLSDANVKVLVHKYQKTGISNIITTTTTQAPSASSLSNSGIVNFKPRPRSYYDSVLLHKAISVPRPLTHEYNENRPPPAPNKSPNTTATTNINTTATATSTSTTKTVTAATVSSALEQAAAASSSPTTAHRRLPQHGKTHPLTRLSLPKQNFNTAAYNTM